MFKKGILGSIMAMFGYEKDPLKPNDKYKKKVLDTPKLGSINNSMRYVRDRTHGTMSRRLARNKVMGRFVFA